MESNHLNETFAALAHPVRRAILERLSTGDATVNELAEPFDMSLPAISKHIKALEKAGLISRSQNAQFRPCRLEPEPIKAIASWTERYREIWEMRFSEMEKILKKIGTSKHAE